MTRRKVKGRKRQVRARATSITVEIVRKPADQVGFAVHSRPPGRRALLRLTKPKRRLWNDRKPPSPPMASRCPASSSSSDDWRVRHEFGTDAKADYSAPSAWPAGCQDPGRWWRRHQGGLEIDDLARPALSCHSDRVRNWPIETFSAHPPESLDRHSRLQRRQLL